MNKAALTELPEKRDNLHVGMASVRPGTGELVAMYGGPDYLNNQLNWATLKARPGSSFKPFALAAALQDGKSIYDTLQGDRALLERLQQAGLQLVAIELLARAISLENRQPRPFRTLIGREPIGASLALAAAADGATSLQVTRVDDAGSGLIAAWTAHAASSSELYQQWYR